MSVQSSLAVLFRVRHIYAVLLCLSFKNDYLFMAYVAIF